MSKRKEMKTPKKIVRGQRVIHKIKGSKWEEPWQHKKLTVCKECGGMGFVPFMKTIGNTDIEHCKCTQCGKEHLCEWWEKASPKEEIEPDETTFNDCDEGCKI
jgi:hypothetical protein